MLKWQISINLKQWQFGLIGKHEQIILHEYEESTGQLSSPARLPTVV